MKKENEQNDFGIKEIKGANVFIDTYNKEVTPERKKELQKKLSQFTTEQHEQKLDFLFLELKYYYQNLPPEVRQTSGTVDLPRIPHGTPLFWDAYIVEEINYIKNLERGEAIRKTELTWNNKTQLCELIYCLCQSNKIRKNGTPIQQKELINLFETIFNIDLKKYYDLLREGMGANKTVLDSKYFTQELLEYAKGYTPNVNRKGKD